MGRLDAAMERQRQYPGLDVVKFFLALLVAERHVIQIFFTEDSRWRLLIGSWLSNLGVPVFFTISGFLLFRKVEAGKPDRTVIRRFCMRSLKLYLVWSGLYLVTDWYNWYNGSRDLAEGVTTYARRFLFDSTIPQLWYLPALALAGFLVWAAYVRGMKIWQILAVWAVLLTVGCLGDNWYFNQRLPQVCQTALQVYWRLFITLRNGVFYGVFYVALGLLFARTGWRLPFGLATAGFVAAMAGMYWEVTHCYNTNFTFLAAPAAYCLFTAASQVRWKQRRFFVRLRGMSEWIYLAHFYFFYFLVWTRPWNPVPFTNKTVTVMIIVPLVVFSWGMVRLAETDRGRWIGRLV